LIPGILAALFPQWRDRDDRLCREIVARGICAPTTDLGIAVRATLARVDSLREMRDFALLRWRIADGDLESLSGIEADLARVVGERDEARRELAALRESVKDVARRMAEQISEVSNG